MKNEYTIVGESCLITLTQGKKCWIDVVDMDLVSKYRWYAHKDGNTYYAISKTPIYNDDGTLNHKHKRMHRLILGTPKKMLADHRDGDGLNNRRENLRTVTRKENVLNSSSHRDSTSKYLGVSRVGKSDTWRADITTWKGREKLGVYTSELEAAMSFAEKFLGLWGEDANYRVTKFYKEHVNEQVSNSSR